MTTNRTQRAAFLLLCAALLGCPSMSAVGVRGGLPAERVATFPPEVQASYDLFTRRCSRCHSLARPLTAQITGREHWSRYVTRMRRQPGSGISPADGETILVFLEYWGTARGTDTSTTGGAP